MRTAILYSEKIRDRKKRYNSIGGKEEEMAIHAEDMVFDKKEQLQKIEDFCQPDEVVRAVFDLKGATSGFIGITDRRVIFYDKAYMRRNKPNELSFSYLPLADFDPPTSGRF